MNDYATLTVPELRELCGKRGLPKYQSKGRRLKKADLVRQLEANDGTATGIERSVDDRRSSGEVNADRTPSPGGIDLLSRRSAGVSGACRSHRRARQTTDRTTAERDLILDYETACKHAAALGITRSELLDEDATTMHRILQGYARPADERHWRTKEVIRGMMG